MTHIRVRRRVALIEPVSRESDHLLPQRRGLRRAQPRPVRRLEHTPRSERFAQRLHLLDAKVTHSLAELIGLLPRQAGDLRGHAEDLLLEQQHAAVGPRIADRLGWR